MRNRSQRILLGLVSAGTLVILFQNCSSNMNTLQSQLGPSEFLSSVDADTVSSFSGVVAEELPTVIEPEMDYSEISCPAGYIKVPPLRPYAYKGFCVAKYEMKNKYGARSEASGSPWAYITRAEAIAACQSQGSGYDLINNAQWQAIARDVADVAANWGVQNGAKNSASAYVGSLSRGMHKKPSVYSGQAASENDNDGCYATGQSCSSTMWNEQRRTQVLSNGEVVWDMSGNLFEWLKDDIIPGFEGGYVGSVPSDHVKKNDFANDRICDSPSIENPCGFGFMWLSDAHRGHAARRGGYWFGIYSGIFTTSLDVPETYSHMGTGFRCVYQP